MAATGSLGASLLSYLRGGRHGPRRLFNSECASRRGTEAKPRSRRSRACHATRNGRGGATSIAREWKWIAAVLRAQKTSSEARPHFLVLMSLKLGGAWYSSCECKAASTKP